MTNNKRIINICRVYEPPQTKDGLWFLVDRLWPRGLKKDKLPFDAWLKEITPTPELRKWFHQEQPKRWLDFARLYIDELRNKPALIEEILEKANHEKMVLFYAAKDQNHNHAKVLKAVLDSWPKTPELDQFS